MRLEPAVARPETARTDAHPIVRGKFLYANGEKLYVRGVTYGTFTPDETGEQFPDRSTVAADFSMMAAAGINSVRTYTAPPIWLLDLALESGLHVMVGLPWEQHVTFLDDAGRRRQIEESVRGEVASCAGHPAVLCYLIGNEIPAPIVRWYGARRVERFLRRLHDIALKEDPGALVTYVNYPSTEYLNLDFLDVLCFNVYLEDRDDYKNYLARLQNVAGSRPLLLTEIGLDSRRNGLDGQAAALEWQVRDAFAEGAAGTFVFAWTDEWYRGGHGIEEWDFGITDRTRQPKPALAAVERAYSEVPFAADRWWPRISVVVCTYNGSRTIRDTLEALNLVEYPDFEVIVVDDGSTDGTGDIAREYAVKVVSTENCGLSSARNTGAQAATGEIVAYTDDDAYPDPHWLKYVAATFADGDWVGVGGPNIAPAGDGRIAECVANAPGGPVHVLLSDREAEHIPGCNMAFRKSAIEAVGGFDVQYRAAGDDVDLCWRLQEGGGKLGFSPSAMVWHHRRNSVRTYWKQQVGYGKAEALLERKWPAKYNTAGHVSWAGRLYGHGLTRALTIWPSRIYHGLWGQAPFQSVYAPAPGLFAALALMPEWFLIAIALWGLAALGIFWAPLLVMVPVAALVTLAPIAQAVVSAGKARFESPGPHLGRRILTAIMHLLQPVARLTGRVKHGLTLWRHRGSGMASPYPRNASVWSEEWRPHDDWLASVTDSLREEGAIAIHGGGFDRRDLEVRGGLLGGAGLLCAVEEHGSRRQLARFRVWPRWPLWAMVVGLALGSAAVAAAADGAYAVAAVLGVVTAGLLMWMAADAGRGVAQALAAIDREAKR